MVSHEENCSTLAVNHLAEQTENDWFDLLGEPIEGLVEYEQSRRLGERGPPLEAELPTLRELAELLAAGLGSVHFHLFGDFADPVEIGPGLVQCVGDNAPEQRNGQVGRHR